MFVGSEDNPFPLMIGCERAVEFLHLNEPTLERSVRITLSIDKGWTDPLVYECD